MQASGREQTGSLGVCHPSYPSETLCVVEMCIRTKKNCGSRCVFFFFFYTRAGRVGTCYSDVDRSGWFLLSGGVVMVIFYSHVGRSGQFSLSRVVKVGGVFLFVFF